MVSKLGNFGCDTAHEVRLGGCVDNGAHSIFNS